MKTKNSSPARNVVLAALFLALAFVLPMVTGHLPQVGNMLCPMHFPILLCGFVLGGPWGLAVGFAAPLFRSVLFGMPPMFPIAISMAFELATYGAVSGWLYRRVKSHNISIGKPLDKPQPPKQRIGAVLTNHNAVCHGFVQCNAALFYLNDQVARNFVHNGNRCVHNKPQLSQVLANFVFTSDFFDSDSFACFCHRNRHHRFIPQRPNCFTLITFRSVFSASCTGAKKPEFDP